jgi:hypothetical protein
VASRRFSSWCRKTRARRVTQRARTLIMMMIMTMTTTQALLPMLESAAAAGEEARLRLAVSTLEEECIICQEQYVEGATLIRLPCAHL